MTDPELDRVIDAWIAAMDAGPGSDTYTANWWAVDEVMGFGPEQTWVFVLSVNRLEVSSRVTANLAAGPLEDLLVYHGSSYIDRVEAEAMKNERFRSLLGGVWRRDMRDDVWQRVQKLHSVKW